MVVIAYGFWQLSFMEHIMKWDMVDDTFPKRFFISECLRNGYMPLWCAYQNMGLPIHADPSSYTWYPLTCLLSLLHGYDFYASNFEYLFHVFFAGLGMYALAKQLKLNTGSGLLMALSYVFSGFTIGNAEHAMFMVAVAWLPFVLSSFLQMLEKPTLLPAIKTGFFLYLLFTGGYIIFTIVAAYFFMVVLVYRVAYLGFSKQKTEMLTLAKTTLLMAVVAIVLSLPFVVSLYQLLPHFTRANALTLDLVMQNPFTFRSFISFLFPFAAIAEPAYWNTDISMTNIYFGLLSFLLLLFTVFVKPTAKQLWFLVAGVFFLSVAMGPELPVREWLYNYYPLMNVSRLPGLFRLFAIIGFIVVAGFTFQQVVDNFETYRKKLLVFLLMFTAVLAAIAAFCYINSDSEVFERVWSGYTNIQFPSRASISEHVFVQACFHLLILLGFVIAVGYSKNAKVLTYAVIVLACADGIIATQLNMAATGIYPVKLSRSQYDLKQQPQGFPFSNTKKLIEITDTRPEIKIEGLWANLHFYDKQTSYNGYTSFYLNNYHNFIHAPFVSAALTNPLVFLSDKALRADTLTGKGLQNHLSLYFNNQDLSELASNKLSLTQGDTVFVTDFIPNKITAHSHTGAPLLVTLMQNNFPGWQVLINGTETKIYTSNYTCITALLPPGDNQIEFVYRPQAVIAAASLSGICLLLTVSFLLWPLTIRFKNFLFQTV